MGNIGGIDSDAEKQCQLKLSDGARPLGNDSPCPSRITKPRQVLGEIFGIAPVFNDEIRSIWKSYGPPRSKDKGEDAEAGN